MFPDGDWEKAQRAAIDAWAQAHKLAAHHGKAVSGWGLDPNPLDEMLPLWGFPVEHIEVASFMVT